MFKLDQNPTYMWTVKFAVPIADGKYEEASFQAELKRLNQERIDELVKLSESESVSNIEIANEVLVGWSGVVANGAEIPFNEDTKKEVLNFPIVPAAVVSAFFDSLRNGKRKN